MISELQKENIEAESKFK